MKKYKNYLISLFFLISLVSCHKKISLDWRIIGESNDKTVKLNFFNLNDVELIIGKTTSIKIPFNADCYGLERPGLINVYFRPDYTYINKYENFEIFVFPLYANQENISDTKIIITLIKNTDVLAYFFKFNLNGKIYIAFSLKNQFYIDKDNLIISDEPERIDVAFFKNMNNDIFVFNSNYATDFSTDDFYDYGGYIVQSRLDDSIIWLDPYL